MIKINITFPHAVVVFEIVSDNNELIDLLNMYYGSLTFFKANGGSKKTQRCIVYRNNILFINNREIYSETSFFSVQKAMSYILQDIRDNLEFEDNWNVYHGSCCFISGKVYLFLGTTHSGKTTLSCFLHHKNNVVSISEDISIVNYVTKEVVPICRPFFIRKNAYRILSEQYNIHLDATKTITYNFGERIVCFNSSTISSKLYKIDEIIILNLNRGEFGKQPCNDMKNILENSFSSNNMLKNVASAVMLYKNIKCSTLKYYNLNDTYDHLFSGNEGNYNVSR